MKSITEIVIIGDLYAVRRTRKSFFLGTKIVYLNLNARDAVWQSEEHSYFRNCLTNDIDKARTAFAECCGESGRPYDADAIISMQDFSKISTLAKSDEGLADLLTQVKEFYILKGNKS